MIPNSEKLIKLIHILILIKHWVSVKKKYIYVHCSSLTYNVTQQRYEC